MRPVYGERRAAGKVRNRPHNAVFEAVRSVDCLEGHG